MERRKLSKGGVLGFLVEDGELKEAENGIWKCLVCGIEIIGNYRRVYSHFESVPHRRIGASVPHKKIPGYNR